MHPEAVEDDERSVRWVVPAGTLAFVGAVAQAPGELGALLADATLESVRAEPAAVVIRLGHGREWRSDGERVRRALQSALRDSRQWVPARGANTDENALLRSAVEQVLAGEVGDYIRSHGGEIALLSVGSRRVQLSLNGACGHCPASDFTLKNRIEVAVRELYPQLEGISAVDTSPGRRLLRLARPRGH